MTGEPVILRRKGQRIESVCPTCKDSQRKGLLWIRGNDYVECPDCGGPSQGHPGVFVVYQQDILPGKSFQVSGLRTGKAEVLIPNRIG